MQFIVWITQHSDPSRKMSTLDCAHLFENKKLCFTYRNVINSQTLCTVIQVWNHLGLAGTVSLSLQGGNLTLINFLDTKFEQNPSSAVMGHCMYSARTFHFNCSLAYSSLSRCGLVCVFLSWQPCVSRLFAIYHVPGKWLNAYWLRQRTFSLNH